jgi:6-phosphofructokinase 1
MEVCGIKRGFAGLMDGEMVDLNDRSVGGILGKGGTFVGPARALEFKTLKGQGDALRNLNQAAVEGLVVIGGNGSLNGALALHKLGFPVVGVPATIDNDVGGTDIAIGVDTTMNTILDAIDKIKDTASSHQRAFLIEVMGRDSGYLALMGSIVGGAEAVLIPEEKVSLDDLAQTMMDAYIRGKAHCIIVVAEGYKPGTQAVVDYLQERKDELGFEVRVTVLGHVQRGGRPLAFDRLLATRLGTAAAQALYDGKPGHVIGLIGNQITLTPLEEALANPKTIDLNLCKLARIMER